MTTATATATPAPLLTSTPIRRTPAAIAAAFAGKTTAKVILGADHGSTAWTAADVRDAVLGKPKQYTITREADGSLYVRAGFISWTVR